MLSFKQTKDKIATDGTPRSVALHFGLHCLPLSHKNDSMLI